MHQALGIQIERLVSLGYAKALGLGDQALRHALSGLARHLPAGADAATFGQPEAGRLPFVLVINSARMPVRQMLPLVERRGQQAVERLYPIAPERFQPLDELQVPPGEAYLLHGIDRGMETLDATPEAAFAMLRGQARSPLTVEEGVALLTHFPEFLQPNNCFLMLGSRCGDKRVPALWLSEKRPRLGWCWAGNPHTWLGSASCSGRSPAVALGAALAAA